MMFPMVSYGTSSALSQSHPSGFPFFHHVTCTISLITTEDPCPSEHRCASDFEPPLKAFRPEQVEISVPKKMCSQNNIYGCMLLADTESWSIFPHICGWRVKSFPLCKSLCCKASSSWLLLMIYQSCCWYGCIRFAIVGTECFPVFDLQSPYLGT